MERFICIHGHFYQPPRENPWLEAIELQDSAYPFHDWNERVTAECYAPNGASRILDAEGRIRQIVNNYANISFNMGPTLLAWMESAAPDVYQSILDADKESQERFGHGSALAQAYSHMIMPLATSRDKRTQVLWGIQDFQHRFGRKPEGMWLPETAVDIESLELMAEQGIAFTILAPRQAGKVRRHQRGAHWEDVGGGLVEPRRPYLVRLPSGNAITVFFYDGPVSQAVAFERLLNRGETFAERLLGAFHENGEDTNLVHIATDGETYGHHHRFGDMALAYACHHLESNKLATITNYAAFLERFPPIYEAQVVENTSWSCVHGVERWRANCGCNTGGHGGWGQEWRAPLREALDWLRDRLAPLYETLAREMLKDPWAARDDYIALVLDRSPEAMDRFFARHAARDLTAEDRIRALKLLEIQRHAMLMYTSCGWFFDELSGIETVQVIQYASRALQLSQDISEDHVEEEFLKRLERAKSNIAEHKDGREIYEKFVRPAAVGWERVAAHYGVASLFHDVPQQGRIYSFTVDAEDFKTVTEGRARLVMGKLRVTSTVTTESANLTFCVLYLGGHTVNGSVSRSLSEEEYQVAAEESTHAFNRADFPEVIRLMDRHFGGATYSLNSLFRDEQRMALDQILDVSLEDAEEAYRHIYEGQAPLLRFLINMGLPLPRPLHMAAELFLNAALRRACGALPLPTERIRNLVAEAKFVNIDLDNEGLGYRLTLTLRTLMDDFVQNAEDGERLTRLLDAVTLARQVPFHANLWKLQNLYYAVRADPFPRMARKAAQGDASAKEWVARFEQLGHQLMIRAD